MSKKKEQHPTSEKQESMVDKALEDTFPASDSPATGGTTRIESDDKKPDAVKREPLTKQISSKEINISDTFKPAERTRFRASIQLSVKAVTKAAMLSR